MLTFEVNKVLGSITSMKWRKRPVNVVYNKSNNQTNENIMQLNNTIMTVSIE